MFEFPPKLLLGVTVMFVEPVKTRLTSVNSTPSLLLVLQAFLQSPSFSPFLISTPLPVSGVNVLLGKKTLFRLCLCLGEGAFSGSFFMRQKIILFLRKGILVCASNGEWYMLQIKVRICGTGQSQ